MNDFKQFSDEFNHAILKMKTKGGVNNHTPCRLNDIDREGIKSIKANLCQASLGVNVLRESFLDKNICKRKFK